MRTFCTIITSNYFPYAATLYQSIIRFHEDEKLVVLVVDEGKIDLEPEIYKTIEIITIEAIYNFKNTDTLFNKYAVKDTDALRWSLKPVLINYLLENGYSKVIYADSDIFFFKDYTFLFDELNNARILLTPCWRTTNFIKNEEEFIDLYTDGLYNAGFIGANRDGISSLEWWANVCSYDIDINYTKGLFVDQKYLDAMPLLFENIKVLKHKGCNIALWNQNECLREFCNGQVLINGTEPIIFIHFTNNYIRELIKGEDHLILPFFKDYESTFAQSGFSLRQYINGLPEYKDLGIIKIIKRKLLLRTRLKRFLYKIIDKI